MFLYQIFKNMYSSTMLFESLKKQSFTKFPFLNLTLAQLKGQRVKVEHVF